MPCKGFTGRQRAQRWAFGCKACKQRRLLVQEPVSPGWLQKASAPRAVDRDPALEAVTAGTEPAPEPTLSGPGLTLEWFQGLARLDAPDKAAARELCGVRHRDRCEALLELWRQLCKLLAVAVANQEPAREPVTTCHATHAQFSHVPGRFPGALEQLHGLARLEIAQLPAPGFRRAEHALREAEQERPRSRLQEGLALGAALQRGPAESTVPHRTALGPLQAQLLVRLALESLQKLTRLEGPDPLSRLDLESVCERHSLRDCEEVANCCSQGAAAQTTRRKAREGQTRLLWAQLQLLVPLKVCAELSLRDLPGPV
mmetsp:Transcript_26512/g.76285  ORF Transcript_26512/g.76285 Transcript_26512/m.76285 type:complete len:315 (-) Transcript_26512:2209-3153(-)